MIISGNRGSPVAIATTLDPQHRAATCLLSSLTGRGAGDWPTRDRSARLVNEEVTAANL